MAYTKLALPYENRGTLNTSATNIQSIRSFWISGPLTLEMTFKNGSLATGSILSLLSTVILILWVEINFGEPWLHPEMLAKQPAAEFISRGWLVVVFFKDFFL